MTYDEWIKYGIEHEYCSYEFCATHDTPPLLVGEDPEDPEWFDGDPCFFCVRLVGPEYWNTGENNEPNL